MDRSDRVREGRPADAHRREVLTPSISLGALALWRFELRVLRNIDTLTTFGEDRFGELYMASGGDVYKLLPVASPLPVPALGGYALWGIGALLLAVPLLRRLSAA